MNHLIIIAALLLSAFTLPAKATDQGCMLEVLNGHTYRTVGGSYCDAHIEYDKQDNLLYVTHLSRPNLTCAVDGQTRELSPVSCNSRTSVFLGKPDAKNQQNKITVKLLPDGNFVQIITVDNAIDEDKKTFKMILKFAPID